MGQEIACVAQFSGKRGQGKVLLETKEIIFRGDFRLKIPFSSIREVKTAKGELRLKTPEGVAVFEIGPKAETWRDKILNPKSLVQKLGIKAGETVTMRGAFSREFRESLKKHGAKIGTSSSPPWILFAAETSGELKVVKSIA